MHTKKSNYENIYDDKTCYVVICCTVAACCLRLPAVQQRLIMQVRNTSRVIMQMQIFGNLFFRVVHRCSPGSADIGMSKKSVVIKVYLVCSASRIHVL